jgi:hypothetical protein
MGDAFRPLSPAPFAEGRLFHEIKTLGGAY